MSADHIRQALRSIYRYNFQKSLRNHANSQRPGYAIGDEPGLVLCTWPHGNRPTLPFIYADEVWTGIEYQVASHMILNGLVDEGLTIVRALRSRYDGRVRNPWNEYECGSYYARAMASYALLTSLSGFSYSAVTRTLVLEPRLTPVNLQNVLLLSGGVGDDLSVGGSNHRGDGRGRAHHRPSAACSGWEDPAASTRNHSPYRRSHNHRARMRPVQPSGAVILPATAPAFIRRGIPP